MSRFWILLLCLGGTTVAISGLDLLLPAIPTLPRALLGSLPEAQYVLAAYVLGSGLGLLGYGWLSDHVDRRILLVVSLGTFALASFACARVQHIHALIGLRVLQGMTGAAPAVFAPGFIREAFQGSAAVRALGAMGSVESLVPALAPLLGAALLTRWNFRASFLITGVIAGLLCLAVLATFGKLPAEVTTRGRGSYRALLMSPVFMRYALSQATTLGGLLTFVFAVPAVIVNVWEQPLAGFIRMQLCGVATFIVAANVTGKLCERHGEERIISLGTGLAAFSGVALVAVALSGTRSSGALAFWFVPFNVGLGLRGPPGFMRAMVAAGGDDARGSALVVLFILACAALGTAGAAPLITRGLTPPATLAAAIALSGVVVLACLPRLPERGGQAT